MKKTLLLPLVVTIVGTSCQKDDPPPAVTSPISYDTGEFMNLKTGTYWTYDAVLIDFVTLEETPGTYHDSIYVVQDTIMGGNTYTQLAGTRFGNPFERYVRIDGPRLIDHLGNTYIDVSVSQDTLSMHTGSFPIDSIAVVVAAQNAQLNTFNGPLLSEHVHNKVFFMTEGFPSPQHEREYFVRNVGTAIYSTHFTSSGTTVEMRLVNYYLAP